MNWLISDMFKKLLPWGLVFILACLLGFMTYKCLCVTDYHSVFLNLETYKKHAQELASNCNTDVIKWINSLGRLDFINLSLIFVTLLIAIGGLGIFGLLVPLSMHRAEKQANKVSREVSEEKLKEFLNESEGKKFLKSELIDIFSSPEGLDILTKLKELQQALGQTEEIDTDSIVRSMDEDDDVK